MDKDREGTMRWRGGVDGAWMAEKHLTRYAAWLVGAVQVTTVSDHPTPTRTVKVTKSDNTKRWRGWGKTGSLPHCRRARGTGCRYPRKRLWRFLTKLCICSQHDPETTLLGIDPGEGKTQVHISLGPEMLVGALEQSPRAGNDQNVPRRQWPH